MKPGARILILDDNELSLRVLLHVLEARGHICEGVMDTASAFERLPAFAPEIILYEWALASDTGVGLPSRMRALGRPLRLSPVFVAVSSSDPPFGFIESEAIDGYLTKPFRIDELDRLLADIIARRGPM